MNLNILSSITFVLILFSSLIGLSIIFNLSHAYLLLFFFCALTTYVLPKIKLHVIWPFSIIATVYFKDFETSLIYTYLERFSINLPFPVFTIKAILIGLALVIIYFYYRHSLNERSLFYKYSALKFLIIFFSLASLLTFLKFESPIIFYLWFLMIILSKYLWYTCYILKDRLRHSDKSYALKMSLLAPLGIWTMVPFVNSDIFFKSPESCIQEFTTRVSGFKLILSSTVVYITAKLFESVVHGQQNIASTYITASLPVPLLSLDSIIMRVENGELFLPISIWASVISYYSIDLLTIYASGNAIVGMLRLCGFNLPVNTSNVFRSKNIAEYYRRYFYYYYELLFEVFYYPMLFFPVLYRHIKVKIFLAVCFAAFIGNFLYHLSHYIGIFLENGRGGLFHSIYQCRTFFFYYPVFALFLSISLIREYRLRSRERVIIFPRLLTLIFPIVILLIKPIYQTSISTRFKLILMSFGF